jgi:hypothetical protein
MTPNSLFTGPGVQAMGLPPAACIVTETSQSILGYGNMGKGRPARLRISAVAAAYRPGDDDLIDGIAIIVRIAATLDDMGEN